MFVVATKDDIVAMSSDGARLITAATDNDDKAVKAFLNEKVDVNSRDWYVCMHTCMYDLLNLSHIFVYVFMHVY
jgi:hypothetical protein